jgi:acyl-coenzyme A thioesterase PaaI-like protein
VPAAPDQQPTPPALAPATVRDADARLADAVRALVDVAVDGRVLDPASLHDAAAEIEAVAARLRLVQDTLPEDGRHAMYNGLRTPMPHWDYVTTDDALLARGRFTNAHTGPPGCVHGGWIALAFDEVLGWANFQAGVGAMTAHLGIRYRKPTPIGAAVEFRVPWPEVHGRRVHTNATLVADGVATAEAEGLFIHFQGRAMPVPPTTRGASPA